MPQNITIPGIQLHNHFFQAPLNHADPEGPALTVFARELRSLAHANTSKPYLIYFQGGPGFPSPRPAQPASGWLKRALGDFHVILLDQRGTGLSSPIETSTLTAMGSDAERAEYLSYFRADAIVRDAEILRQKLLGDQPWSVLGQSFGGFCIFTYLSFFPQAIREALITGGTPPVHRSPDEVYRATYQRLQDKNKIYFERFPDDQELCRQIVKQLSGKPQTLPQGNRLSVAYLQSLGKALGMAGGMESLHFLLETAFAGTKNQLSYNFLEQVAHAQPFNANPLYAILHEAIYCQEAASNWSAQRIMAQEFPEFLDSDNQPLKFTGEMIYPWMFTDFHQLKELRATAEILAGKDDWPPLYDVKQLAQNQTPCAAAVYENDMYVEREYSLETARQTLRPGSGDYIG